MTIKSPYIKLIVLVLLLVQVPLAEAQYYYTRSYSYRTGLPTSYFYDLEQDSLGRIWGLSAIGLYDFDGMLWTKHTIPLSEYDNREDPPKRLYKDQQDNLYVFYDDLKPSTYIYVFDHNSWEKLAFAKNPVIVKDLQVDPKGRMWIGTNGDGIIVKDGDAWKHLTTYNGLPSDSIRSFDIQGEQLLVATRHSIISIATNSMDVDTLHSVKESVIDVIDYSDKLGLTFAVHSDSADQFQTSQVWRLDNETATPGEILGGLPQISILTTDELGGLYIGSKVSGLMKYVIDTPLIHFQQRNSPLANQLSDVLIGRENEIWISHPLGINVFYESPFYHFSASNGFADNLITSLYVSDDNIIFFGHANGAITYLQNQTLGKINLTSVTPAPGIVSGITETEDGAILATTTAPFIFSITPDTIKVKFDDQDGLLPGWKRFHTGPNDQIYIGTNSARIAKRPDANHSPNPLFKIQEQQLRPVQLTQTSPDTIYDYSSAAFDSAGTLYVKFISGDHQSGIAAIHPDGTHQIYTVQTGLFSNLVNAVYVDSRDRLWVAQRGGVSVYDGVEWHSYTADNNLLSSVIYSIFEDNSGTIWIVGNVDVCKFDDGLLTSYTFKEGLFEKEIATAVGIADSNNYIWIGTNDGVYMYDTSTPPQSTPELSLEISEILVDGIPQPLTELETLRLPHSTKTLEIKYATTYLRSPEKIYYQTKMDGIDSEWNPPTSQRSVVYNYLPPGKYQFHIKAGIHGNTGTPVVKSLFPIIISQPLWANEYFLGGLAFSLFLGILGTLQFRYLKTKRTEEQLNDVVEEKTQKIRKLNSEILRTEERQREHIATELHDRVAQYLAMAKVNLGFLKHRLLGTEYSENILSAYNLIDKSIKDTRLIIQELNPPVLHELGFEAAIQWLAEQVQENYDIETQFVNNTSRNFHSLFDMETQIVLFQATREILNNVIKHAHATFVRITMIESKEALRIKIIDNGVGFSPVEEFGNTSGEGGFGLVNIRERLTHLGGIFELESKPNSGTRVTFAIPVPENERYYETIPQLKLWDKHEM